MAKSQDATSSTSTTDALKSFSEGSSQYQSETNHLASAITADLKDQAKRFGEVSQQQAKRMMTAANQQVRAHPTTSMALAASAGLLVGMMMAKR
jgi:ElaB/YqjD/DUF883 family membrane-anchored ribosome-binding protein